jgi:hypothetical protein
MNPRWGLVRLQAGLSEGAFVMPLLRTLVQDREQHDQDRVNYGYDEAATANGSRTPFVWLLSLPLRVIGVFVESILALLRAVQLLPARVLGHRG